MGASSFTALSTPNPPQHLGSGSKNVGLLPGHLCPDEAFSSISGGDKGRNAHVSVSSEDSGGFSRVLGSHTHSLFLWPQKHLPKESQSIKRVWLVCTQQCTVGSGHLQESTRQGSWGRSVLPCGRHGGSGHGLHGWESLVDISLPTGLEAPPFPSPRARTWA